MDQRQRILESRPTTHTVAGRVYAGENPLFAERKDPLTGVVEFVKVRKGIPFIRV